MKTERNLLIAFLLNLSFSVIETIGGLWTGSIAVISDALHDLGDSISIGVSYLLERISKNKPDAKYSYGYLRFSLLGSLITGFILLSGSAVVIYHSIVRWIHPVPVNYNGMILFAVAGVLINGAAAYFTKDGDSLNQKTVNLHMLEDVLGWVSVLVTALIMKFTETSRPDSIISICVAIYILIHAVKHLREILEIFLERTPRSVNLPELKEELCRVKGISEIHHLHIVSIDGFHHKATLHVVTDSPNAELKHQIRHLLADHQIVHATIETELPTESCEAYKCDIQAAEHHHHHH